MRRTEWSELLTVSLAFVSTRGVTRWGHPAGFIDFYAQHLIAGEKVFGDGGGGGGGGGGHCLPVLYYNLQNT